MEERIIKLIWDYRGEDSFDTAKHHQIHLSDYLQRHKLEDQTGVEKKSNGHAIAWIATPEHNMITLRDALIPHRAEVFEENY
jgi:hypothetical protein